MGAGSPESGLIAADDEPIFGRSPRVRLREDLGEDGDGLPPLSSLSEISTIDYGARTIRK